MLVSNRSEEERVIRKYPSVLALNSGLYDGFLFYVIIYSPEV